MQIYTKKYESILVYLNESFFFLNIATKCPFLETVNGLILISLIKSILPFWYHLKIVSLQHHINVAFSSHRGLWVFRKINFDDNFRGFLLIFSISIPTLYLLIIIAVNFYHYLIEFLFLVAKQYYSSHTLHQCWIYQKLWRLEIQLYQSNY